MRPVWSVERMPHIPIEWKIRGFWFADSLSFWNAFVPSMSSVSVKPWWFQATKKCQALGWPVGKQGSHQSDTRHSGDTVFFNRNTMVDAHDNVSYAIDHLVPHGYIRRLVFLCVSTPWKRMWSSRNNNWGGLLVFIRRRVTCWRIWQRLSRTEYVPGFGKHKNYQAPHATVTWWFQGLTSFPFVLL